MQTSTSQSSSATGSPAVPSSGSSGEATESYQPKFPKKMGPGTKGTKMIVETNYMPLLIRDKNMIIMHYDVDMKIVNKDESLKDCPKKYLK